MPDNLTFRQAQFPAQYIAHKGNGTKAAIAAGYSPSGAHVEASRLLRNPKIKEKIEKLVRRHEISAERVLTRLDNLSSKAEEAGNYPAAVRAEELIGKSLGMWVDRSVNVNLDITGEHVAAIRALASRRIQKNTTPRAGDDAKLIEADKGNAVYSYNMHYGKSDANVNAPNSVIDQRVSQDATSDADQATIRDADGHKG